LQNTKPFIEFSRKKPLFFCISDKCIYQVFEWKNPGKKLANFAIIESSTFWTGSAALSPMELNREADDRHLKTVEK
jgi:hypothetical protein